MTQKADMQPSGVERLRTRRFKLVRYSLLGIAAGVLFGMSSGMLGGLYEQGALSGWVIVALWAIGLAAFLLYALDYLRRIDELDRLDNLWAVHWGFMFYLLAYPTWDYFARLGMVPEPNSMALWIATVGVVTVVYIARKLGLR